MTLQELRDKRAELATEIKKVAEKFEENNRSWKDDAQAEAWEKVNRDYDDVLKKIETEEARQAQERSVSDRLAEINAHDTNPTDPHPPGLEDTRTRRPVGEEPEITEETRALALAGWLRGNRASERQREACQRLGMDFVRDEMDLRLYNTTTVRQLQREWNTVHRDRALTHTLNTRAMSAFQGSTGGVLVPETLVRMLEVNMLAFGGVRQVADTIVTGTGERMAWPTADDTSNSGEMLGESGSIGSSVEPSFQAVYWDAYKFSSKPVLVPYELLEDSFMDLPGFLGQILGERLGRITATKHTTGTGASEPKGIVTCASLGVTAASATAITYDEVIDLEHAIDPAYRNGAGYMCHDNILLYLRKLKDGNGQYLWQSGANTGAPDRLNNRPLAISMEMASSVATSNKTLLFGQLSKHKIRRVNGIRLYRLQERYRDNDQDGFIAFLREDSNMLDAGTAPVKYLQQA